MIAESYFEFIKVEKVQMYHRTLQYITFKNVETKKQFRQLVAHRIDLSSLKRGDKILLVLSLTTKGSLSAPYFYITDVMLLNDEEVKSIDERRSEKSPRH